MNQPPAATTQNFHTLSIDVHLRIIDSAVLSYIGGTFSKAHNAAP